MPLPGESSTDPFAQQVAVSQQVMGDPIQQEDTSGFGLPSHLSAIMPMPTEMEDQSALLEVQEDPDMASLYQRGLGLGIEGKDGLIWKPVCKTGVLALSPGPGQTDSDKPLELTPDLFDSVKRAYDARAIEHVTIPETHGNGVLENTGYVKGLEVLSRDQMLNDERIPESSRKLVLGDPEDTRYLMAGMAFTEPDVRDKVLRGSVANTSVGIKFNYRRKRDGESFPAVLEHVALTNQPWVDGLVPFGQMLSQERSVGYGEPQHAVYTDLDLAMNESYDENYEVIAPGMEENEAPESLSESMPELIGDLFTLYLTAHGFHWNVRGQDFAEYHALFGAIYEDVWESIDDWAENMRKIGMDAPFRMSDLMNLRETQDVGPVPATAQAMSQQLSVMNDSIIDEIQEVFDAATAQNEQGLANFAADRLDHHKKWAWQLDSSSDSSTHMLSEDEPKDSPVKKILGLSRFRKNATIERKQSIQPQGRQGTEHMDKTVEQLLASQQAELEAQQQRASELESQLALAQGTIASQGEQLHKERVTKRIQELQGEGVAPSVLARAESVMLADFRPNNEDSLSLSVTSHDGDEVSEREFGSATDVVEFLLSAMPRGESASGLASVISGLDALGSKKDEGESVEEKVNKIRDFIANGE